VTPETAHTDLRSAYVRATGAAGGSWHSLVTVGGSDDPAVDDGPDEVVPAASVNKLAIACAVLHLVDRGELSLDRTVEVTADVVLPGDGVFHLQPVWGDRVTLAHVITAMLLVSDNTAVRLCGRVCPGPAVNDYLAGEGFAHTRVEPLAADPSRMELGWTTARETHDLVRRLADGALLAPATTRFALAVLRAPGGHHDGVRRIMSSAERARVAVKHGAYGTARNEIGAVFGADDRPRVVFAFFADHPRHGADLGATHPATEARATLGRPLLDAARQAFGP
jgi:beta-lactamase class A